jgi:hypothetical protein
MHVNKRFSPSGVCRIRDVKFVIAINYQINVPAVRVPTIIDFYRIPIASIIDAVPDLVISTVDMNDVNVTV